MRSCDVATHQREMQRCAIKIVDLELVVTVDLYVTVTEVVWVHTASKEEGYPVECCSDLLFSFQVKNLASELGPNREGPGRALWQLEFSTGLATRAPALRRQQQLSRSRRLRQVC